MIRASAINSNKRTQEMMNNSTDMSSSAEESEPTLQKRLKLNRARGGNAKGSQSTPGQVRCEECDKEYASISSLRQHMRNIHKMNLKCTNKSCNRLFRVESERDTHSNSCKIRPGDVVGGLETVVPPAPSSEPLRKYPRARGRYSDGILTVEILEVGNKEELFKQPRYGSTDFLDVTLNSYLRPNRMTTKTVGQSTLPSMPQQPAANRASKLPLPHGPAGFGETITGLHPRLELQEHAYGVSNQNYLMSRSQQSMGEAIAQNHLLHKQDHSPHENAPQACLQLEAQRHVEGSLPQNLSVSQNMEQVEGVAVQADPSLSHQRDNEAHTYPSEQLVKMAKASLQGASRCGFELLDEYEERRLEGRDVVTDLSRIMEGIANFDEYIRGKDRDSNEDIRNELRVLDRAKPLAELLEVLTEPSSVFRTRSQLLLLLRCMFNVQSGNTLVEKLKSIGLEIQLLPLSIIIRGCLAYLIKYEIFEERDLETETLKSAQLKTLTEFHGIRTAGKLVQYIGLLALKEDSFQKFAGTRAYEFAASFHDVLHPLTHWLPQSPKNSKQQHIKMIAQVVRESIQFAAQLKARLGRFSFYWPKSGEYFDPTKHEVDMAAQLEMSNEELPNTNIDMRKQKVACTTMFAVWRKIPGRDREEQYSKAKVVLMTPYVK